LHVLLSCCVVATSNASTEDLSNNTDQYSCSKNELYALFKRFIYPSNDERAGQGNISMINYGGGQASDEQ